MGRLDGLVAIVTGGTTGIGRAITERFQQEGARVAATRLPAADPPPTGDDDLYDLDVRSEEDVMRVVDAVAERHGGLDVLVNNAALTGPPVIAPLLDHPVQLFREVMDTNLLGPFLMTKAAAAVMARSGRGGRIINLGSVNSFIAEEFAAGYVASKAGMLGLTRACAVELAAHAITVNAIAPGQIFTEAGLAAIDMVRGGTLPYRFYREAPLGPGGQPRDVAGVAAFLASADAGWITGTTIVVDGGFLAT